MAKADSTPDAGTKEPATAEKSGGGNCFVLMPFTVRESDVDAYLGPDHWTEVYRHLIRPALRMAGLEPDRDDEDRGSRIIVDDIIRKIEAADFILCDLSTYNPNVFLELGWTFRADKPYVLIHDDVTPHVFDLNQQYTYKYASKLQPTRLQEDVEKLSQVVTHTREDRERRYSHVSRLSVNLQTIAAASGGDAQARTQLEILDRLRRIEERTEPTASAAPRRVENADHPWPRLLHGATRLLTDVKAAVAACGPSGGQNQVIQAARAAASAVGAVGSEDVQVSLISADRTFVMHDRPEMVGRPAAYSGLDGSDMYDDMYAFAEGAVAWADRGVSAPGLPPRRGDRLRYNIALFAPAPPTDLKVVVEVHYHP